MMLGSSCVDWSMKFPRSEIEFHPNAFHLLRVSSLLTVTVGKTYRTGQLPGIALLRTGNTTVPVSVNVVQHHTAGALCILRC